MRYHARLAKLEAVIPETLPADADKPCLTERLEQALSASSWLRTASPVERYRHYSAKLAGSSEPIQGFLAARREAIRATLIPILHWRRRAAELDILAAHGYDTSVLAKAHAAHKALPQQWDPTAHPLPDDAETLIAIETFED